MSSINLKNICKKYVIAEEDFFALDNLSLTLQSSQLTTIIGHSGSGKSTLLNILGGMSRPSSGQYMFNHTDITKLSKSQLTKFRKTEVGYVYQFYNLVNNLTAYENVLLSAQISSVKADPAEYLSLVGLEKKMNRYPYELSGGEQQRVSIARALIKHPSVLVCDEPTGALDFKNGLTVIDLLRKIANNGCTVIVATHNVAIADIADINIMLRDGKLVSVKKNENIVDAASLVW